jgi:colanic acid biosynthesis glycosyl transferase WcaI
VVQDLMADAAAKLGIIRWPALVAILRAVERRALRAGSQLITISEEMKTRLGELTGRDAEVIPNWIHGSLQSTVESVDLQVVKRQPCSLFYSGNLGVKQGLPDFLPLFFAQSEGWALRVHGAGPEAETMRKAHEANPRFQLEPLLEEPDYVRALQKATVCLITQRPGAGQSFLPSKLLPALATGTPVLAACDADSPLGREVSTHGFGAVVRPGDQASLGQVLRAWRDDPAALANLRVRATERARAFSRDKVLSRYEALLMDQVRIA